MFLRILSQLMSDVSEDCWCAGWMAGTEDSLPALCWLAVRTQRPQHWGQDYVGVGTAQDLIEVADLAGSWVDFEGNPYQPDWERMTEYFGELAQPVNRGED